MDRNTAIFTEYAKLPTDTVSNEGYYAVIALVVVIDSDTGMILEAECSLSTNLENRFVSQLLVGKKLRSESEKIVNLIKTKYHGLAKKAIIHLLGIIIDKYLAIVSD